MIDITTINRLHLESVLKEHGLADDAQVHGRELALKLLVLELRIEELEKRAVMQHQASGALQ